MLGKPSTTEPHPLPHKILYVPVQWHIHLFRLKLFNSFLKFQGIFFVFLSFLPFLFLLFFWKISYFILVNEVGLYKIIWNIVSWNNDTGKLSGALSVLRWQWSGIKARTWPGFYIQSTFKFGIVHIILLLHILPQSLTSWQWYQPELTKEDEIK